MTDWPLVPLGELLTQVSDRHRVEAGRTYPNIGLYSFGRGVFHKQPIDGSTTSATHLFRIRAGQTIYSRLFAFEGAYAIVSDVADGAYVSNEYPVFDIDAERVLPAFLGLVLKLPATWEALALLTSGMGDRRRRLRPERFLSHRIPLPPLPEQERIAESLHRLSGRVDEAKRLRAEVQADTGALLHSTFYRLIQGADYRPLGEVAPIVRRPVEIELDGEYPELGVRAFGNGIFHKPTLLGADLDWQKLFRIEPGDLIVSNIKAWEGAVAVATDRDQGRVASHRYITCVPRTDLALAEFLSFYLLTDEGNDQIQAASPGSADRNRTLAMSRLEQIQVSLPPLGKQQQFTALQA